MPRIPSNLKGQPFGTTNPNGSRRAMATPAILTAGPAVAREQFNAPNIPMEVARALNQVQTNVQQAVVQAKGNPQSDSNFLSQYNITNGSVGPPPTGANVIAHQLGRAYKGVRIEALYNGYLLAYSVLPPTTDFPADKFVLLLTIIGGIYTGTTMSADILVY